MRANNLNIVHSDSEVPDETEEYIFIIEDIIEKVDPDRYDRRYNTISSVGRNSDRSNPLVSIYWPRLSNPTRVLLKISKNIFGSRRSNQGLSLNHRTILSEELSSRIQKLEPERIVCSGVSEEYLPVITDVAEHHNIEIDAPSKPSIISGYLFGLPFMMFLLGDILFSLLLSVVITVPTEADTVFVPNYNRSKSLKTVVDRVEETALVVVPGLTIQWAFQSLRGEEQFPEIKVVPLGIYATHKVLLSELYFTLVQLPERIIESEQILRSELRSATGIDLCHTVRDALHKILRQPIGLYNHPLGNIMVDRISPHNVVFGAAGPPQMGIMNAIIENDVDGYYVPHGITSEFEAVPHKEITQFVASPLGKQYLEESNLYDGVGNIEATGRPYFQELKDGKSGTKPSTESEYPYIVIATQPYRDQIRDQFISNVINGMLNTLSEVDIIIKIHPNEARKFYEDYEGVCSEVSIADSNLRYHLRQADVVITMTSNVGLEAMLFRTPTVCYALFKSINRLPLYAQYGPVPTPESAQDVAELMGELDELLLESREKTWDFMTENYLSENDPAGRIADHLNE
jgi:hypothetical protein